MTKKKAVHAGLAQIDAYSRSAHLLVFNNEAFLFNCYGSALNEARSLNDYSFQRRLFPEALKNLTHTNQRAHEGFETNLARPLAHEGFVYFFLVFAP